MMGAVQMQITTIGFDLAKNVFQLRHRRQGEGGCQEAAPARPGDGVFQSSAAVPDRYGGLCYRTLLGARVDEARPRGAFDAGEGREGLRQTQQERCRRCRGDLRSGSAADDAFRADQVGRTAGSVDAAPHARCADTSAHPDHQRLAGASGRARHRGRPRRRRGQRIEGNRGGRTGHAVTDRCAGERVIVLAAQLEALQTLIGSIEKRIKMQHRSNETSQRVETIPGIGVLGATAIVATAADPTVFRSGRDFAAWIGLVPRQDSTGGKQKLGPISKQGDRYLRRILVVGAIAVLRRAQENPGKYPWLTQLLARRPFKVVAVALANKMARTAWALMVHGGTYRAPELAEAA